MLSTLSLIGLGQCAALILAVLVLLKKWTPLKFIVLGLLLLVGLRLAKTALVHGNSAMDIPMELFILTRPLGLLVLPAIYLLQRVLVKPNLSFRKTDFLHLLIPGAVLVYAILATVHINIHGLTTPLANYPSQVLLELSIYEIDRLIGKQIPVVPILAILQTPIYAWLSFKHWRTLKGTKRDKLLNQFWSQQIALFTAITCVVITALLTASTFTPSIPLYSIITFVTVSSLTILIGCLFYGLFQIQANTPQMASEKVTATEPLLASSDAEAINDCFPIKYMKSGLSEERMEILYKRTVQLLSDQKLFRLSQLTLNDLADAVKCSRHHLSQTLNFKLTGGYVELINEMRLAEAKHNLIHSPSTSILDIAMEAGFNSKSGFYNAFKKDTGLTPSAYRKNHSVTQLTHPKLQTIC